MVVRVLACIDGSCVEYVKNISRSYPPPAVVFFAVGRLPGRVRSRAFVRSRARDDDDDAFVEFCGDGRGGVRA